MAASTPNPPPEPPTEGSVDAVATESTFRGWVRGLSKGFRWLLGVIIAALVGAVITGLVTGWFGPEELGADLSEVAIDRNVTLDEYSIRHASDSASTPNRATVVRVAAQLVAQTPTDGTTMGGTTPDGTTPDGTTPDGTTPDGTTTGGTTPDDAEGIVRRLQLSAGVRERLNAGVGQAIDDLQMEVGPTCENDASDPNCPIPEVLGMEKQGKDAAASGNEEGLESAEDVARRLEEIFNGTRERQGQMVGVTVNFRVSMTGFDEGTADIRWSLYSAKSGVPVPRDWLRLQPALSLRGEADKDSAREDFWVPIPEIKGPFFIRLGVYDKDDTRLDFADTARFR